jgi:hypothetical protein
MDVIGVATYYYWIAFKIIADSTQIIMKFRFHGMVDEGLTMLRAEDNVKVILNE